MPRRFSAGGIAFDACRKNLSIPDSFPEEVEATAQASAGRPRLPAVDATDIQFVTLDPAGSLDLDQAAHLARRPDGTGFRVRYAIADVGAFIAPGDPLDQESAKRAVTIYSPDRRSPLYPPVLGEGAASLLPEQDRPAIVWTIDLDDEAQPQAVAVERALVRSRARLDYPSMQHAADVGTLPDPLALLAEFGPRRLAIARARHAIDLDLPEQEVVRHHGGWTLEFREVLPIENWNAELSLLTGMMAAQLFLKAGVGLLRTVPEALPNILAHLRRVGATLGITWAPNQPVGDVLAGLDGSSCSFAFREAAASLLRGAGYTAFDGGPPKLIEHAGVGAPYAHVTAPLRRLADRYANEVVLAVARGEPPPEWARHALPDLPATMAEGDRRARLLEHCIIERVGALLLSSRIGQSVEATVVEVGPEGATVVIHDPAIRARIKSSELAPASLVTLTVVAADPSSGRTTFAVSGRRNTSPSGGGR